MYNINEVQLKMCINYYRCNISIVSVLTDCESYQSVNACNGWALWHASSMAKWKSYW